MAPMHRAQILLEPEQHRELESLARRAGRSTSDLVREIVGDFLAHRSADESRSQAVAALEWLAASRGRLAAGPDVFPEGFLEEMRDERDAELGTRTSAEEAEQPA